MNAGTDLARLSVRARPGRPGRRADQSVTLDEAVRPRGRVQPRVVRPTGQVRNRGGRIQTPRAPISRT